MKRTVPTFLLILLLFMSAEAELDNLLRWQREGDSRAYVSSGFHDWRGVSRYRRNPGIHAGYDIAMWAGSVVRTPWRGRVVAVTPWYGSEVGVTVRLDNGWEATFGHIHPCVRVGQQVEPGQALGKVAVDHVDVKMRNASGDPVDFATVAFAPVLPRPTTLTTRDDSRAFDRYKELLTLIALTEHKVALGLTASGALETQRSELRALEPLARRHAASSEIPLPSQPLTLPAIPQKSSRPVTDTLLEL